MTHLLKLTANKIEWLNQSSRKIVQNLQAKTTSKQPIFPFITQFSGQKLNNLPYFFIYFVSKFGRGRCVCCNWPNPPKS